MTSQITGGRTVEKTARVSLKQLAPGAIVSAVAAAIVLSGGLAIAQRPADNVSPRRHPNLAAAQRFSTQAFEKIIAAQHANEWDMEGHAQKAKELLEQVNRELKVAAEIANQKHK
jgi:hypothetical protein